MDMGEAETVLWRAASQKPDVRKFALEADPDNKGIQQLLPDPAENRASLTCIRTRTFHSM